MSTDHSETSALKEEEALQGCIQKHGGRDQKQSS